MPLLARDESTRASAILKLEEARERTMLLVASLSGEQLRGQHHELMSPIIWDLGHIAHFEELWLTRNLQGPIQFSEMPGMYNPMEHPRSTRGALELPSIAEWKVTSSEIRRRVLASLDSVTFSAADPLLRDGYIVNMVLQHEYQHNETMLQALQLLSSPPYKPPRRWHPPTASRKPTHGQMARFPGGDVSIGTDDRSAAYDNERPLHYVTLAPFEIDVEPVCNCDYLEFMRDEGYARRELWSDAGWRWLNETGAQAPLFWERRGEQWFTRKFDLTGPVDESHPVCHVCYHEAEAYARWAAKRLPTEAEWEAAATWDTATGKARAYPWGEQEPSSSLANLDQLSFGTAPLWSYPHNLSPIGCYGMIGDAWEWTSSDFRGYPGFQAFPYPEYSESFFGSEYRVLRGGSWATRPGAIRASFRNWDYPIRRQIFAGFRCARDA